MKTITTTKITEAVSHLCMEAAYFLPEDVRDALEDALQNEESEYGRYALDKICKNAHVAREGELPLCQDTGCVVVFAEVGQDVHITGGSFEDAIHAGVAQGYTQGYLRKSMVCQPLFERKNTNDNTPAIIHTRIVPGEHIKLYVLPKGAGSENMTRLGMLKPAQGEEGVEDFVVESVVRAGGNPCPPIIVGVGLGGNAEHALLLSKCALQRKLGQAHPDKAYAALERRLLDRINALGIGPQGFGGCITALAVHVEYSPTHIATLPVGVTINCHAARHKQVIL